MPTPLLHVRTARHRRAPGPVRRCWCRPANSPTSPPRWPAARRSGRSARPSTAPSASDADSFEAGHGGMPCRGHLGVGQRRQQGGQGVGAADGGQRLGSIAGQPAVRRSAASRPAGRPQLRLRSRPRAFAARAATVSSPDSNASSNAGSTEVSPRRPKASAARSPANGSGSLRRASRTGAAAASPISPIARAAEARRPASWLSSSEVSSAFSASDRVLRTPCASSADTVSGLAHGARSRRPGLRSAAHGPASTSFAPHPRSRMCRWGSGGRALCPARCWRLHTDAVICRIDCQCVDCQRRRCAFRQRRIRAGLPALPAVAAH